MEVIWCRYCGRLIDILSIYAAKISDYCKEHKGKPSIPFQIKKDRYSRFDYEWAKEELDKLSEVLFNKFNINLNSQEIEFEKEILEHMLKKEIRETGVLDHTISDHLRAYTLKPRGKYFGKYGPNSFKKVAIKRLV